MLLFLLVPGCKQRLLRDSHRGATLTQTQNKTRQNYYANIHFIVMHHFKEHPL